MTGNMPSRLLLSLLILLGFTQPASARTLAVEVEFLHLAGLMTQAELSALLASPQLRIEAHYHPEKLIDGVTARRERVMPIGSKLFALGQITVIPADKITRQGLNLRFSAEETHPAHASYRLQSLRLVVPLPPGPGRPQPNLEITFADPLERQSAHEKAFVSRNAAFSLGLRLRYRWNDAQGAYISLRTDCDTDVQAMGNGQYRFRPEQKLLRLLGSIDFGGVGQKMPAGARRFLLAPPYPAPLTGWQPGDQQLVQLRAEGKTLESMTLHAERTGEDACRYTRIYNAWFADGKPVQIKRSAFGLHTEKCEQPRDDGATIEIQWNDDGTLASFMESSPRGTRLWDGFRAGNPSCEAQTQPTSGEVEALRDEFARLRAAFLKGKP
jgi:hypothetical protein